MPNETPKPNTTPATTSPVEPKSQAGIVEKAKAETAKVNADMRKEAAARKAKESTPVKGWSLPSVLDISDISNIYGCLRDGDYFDAFRRATALLNKLLNPDPVNTAKVKAVKPMTQADRDDFDSQCDKLEALLETLRDDCEDDTVIEPQPRVMASANTLPSGTQFSLADALVVVQILMDLVNRFRNRNKDTADGNS